MTDGERRGLAWASILMEYPDAAFFARIPQLKTEIAEDFADPDDRDLAAAFLEYLDRIQSKGELQAQENYVAVFDHDPAASLYMTWHRYGNDRSQGKAMAALNGLYRAAGLEPGTSAMPDYLPRMLEFLSVCDDWAADTLLDGFGPELAGLLAHLSQLDCDQGDMLSLACAPLQREWPARFKPRTGADPTARPMARPEPEENLFEIRWKQPAASSDRAAARDS